MHYGRPVAHRTGGQGGAPTMTSRAPAADRPAPPPAPPADSRPAGPAAPRRGITRRQRLRRDRTLLLMTLPAVGLLLVFTYVPLLGNVVAFQDYDVYGGGITGSAFVGFENFAAAFGRHPAVRMCTSTTSTGRSATARRRPGASGTGCASGTAAWTPSTRPGAPPSGASGTAAGPPSPRRSPPPTCPTRRRCWTSAGSAPTCCWSASPPNATCSAGTARSRRSPPTS